MANSFFRFKQFVIHQEKAAMKVCTDACLFGALLPKLNNPAFRVLDIGTGTGLLSIMFAQNHPQNEIDSVEIDENAFQQAVGNVQNSDLGSHIHIFHQDIVEFSKDRNAIYDLIFSNPPFYENDLKSINESRNKALHSTELNFTSLIKVVDKLLIDSGIFCVLLPYKNYSLFLELANRSKFSMFKVIHIKQTIHHDYFRSVVFFRRINDNILRPVVTELIIKTENGHYTSSFEELLADYYLYL